MQMAEVAATVANGGKLMQPTFVQQVTDSDGRATQKLTPHVQSTLISPQTASELTTMMTHVTQEGTAAGLTVSGNVPSRARREPPRSAARATGSTSPGSLAFAPATNPQVAVAATIERCQGCFGGEVGGPGGDAGDRQPAERRLMQLAQDTVVAGRYRLLGRLGSGGMADVWCAEDSLLNRRVALKFLHERFAQDEQFVERFRREASSAAGLQHPNVVGVFDRGTFDGAHFIAMEYVEGASLKDLIERGLSVPEAVEIVRQVLAGVKYAHEHGIVHRDLKPQNVLVDSEGRARVTDFGIARAGASEITQTGSVLGTAQYLSPEQAQGLPVTAASDIYSVGVMLYEALTGRVPFDADSPVTVALKQVSERPRPPSELNPAVSRALDGWCCGPRQGPGEPLRVRRRVPRGARRRGAGPHRRRVRRHGLLRGGRGRGRDRAARPAGGASGEPALLHAVADCAPGAPPPAARGRPPRSSCCGAEGRRTSWCRPCSESRRTKRRRSSPTPGFRCRQKAMPRANAPVGKVIEQDPTAGSRVPKGSTVTITVFDRAGDGAHSGCRGDEQGRRREDSLRKPDSRQPSGTSTRTTSRRAS